MKDYKEIVENTNPEDVDLVGVELISNNGSSNSYNIADKLGLILKGLNIYIN